MKSRCIFKQYLVQLCEEATALVDGLAICRQQQAKAKQPLYPIMCWCQMFAWNGWSPLGTRRRRRRRHRHRRHRRRRRRRRRRPLLRRKFFTKLTLAQYTNPAHEISHHQRLRVDSWQRKSEDNKSSSESEKIVKQKKMSAGNSSNSSVSGRSSSKWEMFHNCLCLHQRPRSCWKKN